jgi:hypothetical protein
MKNPSNTKINFLMLYSILFGFLFTSLSLQADPYPPDNIDDTSGMHYAPVAWPAKSEWKVYTRFSNLIGDPRTQDPSNGGTSPQNYVNIASSCVDTNEPSVYYS